MISDDNGGLAGYQHDEHVSTFRAVGRIIASTVDDFGGDPVLFQRQENQGASSTEQLPLANAPKDIANATLVPIVSKVMLHVCFGKHLR